jgi:hypothetical protein
MFDDPNDRSDRTYSLCGTEEYAAPEMLAADGRGHTKAVDVWNVGVVLYIMLCGSPPPDFENDNSAAPHSKVSFPPSLWRRVSKPAQALVQQLLTVDPTRRPLADKALGHNWLSWKSEEEEKEEKEQERGYDGSNYLADMEAEAAAKSAAEEEDGGGLMDGLARMFFRGSSGGSTDSTQCSTPHTPSTAARDSNSSTPMRESSDINSSFGFMATADTPTQADAGIGVYGRQRGTVDEPWSEEKELREMSRATRELRQNVYATKIQAAARARVVRKSTMGVSTEQQEQRYGSRYGHEAELDTATAAARVAATAARVALSAVWAALTSARQADECALLVASLKANLMQQRAEGMAKEDFLASMCANAGGVVLLKHGRRGRPRSRRMFLVEQQQQEQQANYGNQARPGNMNGSALEGMRLEWREAQFGCLGGGGNGVGGGGSGGKRKQGRGIDLGMVVQVCSGVQTPLLQKKQAELGAGGGSALASCCFSLVTSSRTVDLQAPSAAERDRLVHGFNTLLGLEPHNAGSKAAMSSLGQQARPPFAVTKHLSPGAWEPQEQTV